MRKTVFVVGGTALLMGLLTGTASATPAANSGCPTAYEPVTLAELLVTPEVLAAFEDHVYDADHIVTAFNAANQNGDDLVCYKSVANDDNTHFMVYYAGRYMDNHAGPKK
ncbi:MAG: hypothetical protein IPO93_17190 [Actinobacteria bacterium]|jgi:hypothetical protein|nr:hypothetical protein [Actinomycetota bacterium]